RIDKANPAASLLLRKPTMQTPHGGGLRFKTGSALYQVLERWLKAGAPLQPEFDPRIVHLAVYPAERVFGQQGVRQPIVVSAQFDDGAVQDVTRVARFSPNDDEVATVDDAGLLTSGKSGETAIMVRYLGRVGVTRVTVLPPWKIAAYPRVPANNVLDER